MLKVKKIVVIILILLCSIAGYFYVSENVLACGGEGEEPCVVKPAKPDSKNEEYVKKEDGNYNNETEVNNLSGDDDKYKITNKVPCGDTQVTGSMEFGGQSYVTTAGNAPYSCCPPDNVKCPRWICGTGAQFGMAYDNAHVGQGFNDSYAEKCRNSNNTVCWVGQLSGVNGGMTVVNTDSIGAKGISNSINLSGGQMSAASQSVMNTLINNSNMTADTIGYFCEEIEDLDPEEKVEEPVDKCDMLASGGDVTDVISGVKKESGAWNWEDYGFVWAFPGENISFKDCYYSGLQSHRNDEVTPLVDDEGNTIEWWRSQLTAKGWHSNSCASENGIVANCNTIAEVRSRHDAADKELISPGLTTLKKTVKKRWGWDNGFEVIGTLESTIISQTFSEDENPTNHKHEPNYVVDPFDVGKPEGAIVNANAKVFAGTELKQTINSNFLKKAFNMPRVYVQSPDVKPWDCWFYTPLHECNYDSKDYNPSCPPNGATVVKSHDEDQDTNNDGIMDIHKWWYTYYNNDTKPSKCSTTNPWREFTFTGGPATHTSGILVPYNYINYGKAEISSETIYAGEKGPRVIRGIAVTDQRYNPVTKGTYATIAPNSSWAVMGYISADSDGSGNKPNDPSSCSSQCEVYDRGSGVTFNESGNVDGSEQVVWEGGGYNLWDTEAGNYFCVVTAVTSATSGRYTNLSPDGDGVWATSNPVCRVISKKPTFQIRGGGLYIDTGKVGRDAETSKKNNVAGFISYQKTGNPGYTSNYYSWVDQSATIGSGAKFYRFSSGAAVNSKDNISVEEDGVEKSKAYNHLVFNNGVSDLFINTRRYQPLTLPSPGIKQTNDMAGIGATLNASFKQIIINSVIKTAETSEEQNIEVIRGCSVGGADLTDGKKLIIDCNGELTINGNIEYSGTFESIDEIPTAIIHANSIQISPNVTRIDAWVLADSLINTCKGGNNVIKDENNACNNSLTINGPVVAHEINLTREYGAGAGYRSLYPAELFNLSTSAYLSAAASARLTDSGTPQTVYTREIAPRY